MLLSGTSIVVTNASIFVGDETSPSRADSVIIPSRVNAKTTAI
jgi:hypothetical protein